MPEVGAQISRVKRSKLDAKISYDKLSRWYDLLAGLAEKRYKTLGLQKLQAKRGETILEIGFGTGHCILALAESVGPQGKIHGIDISEGMYKLTQARVNKAGFTGRVELERGDAIELLERPEAAFDEAEFDAIFMSFTLELFDTPEIPVILQACWKALKGGGRICVVAMARKTKRSLMVRLYEWVHDTFERVADCRPIFVQRALLEAGFFIIDTTELSMFGLPVDIAIARKVS